MSIFEDAKINFKKNNYLRSAELFQEAIVSDELTLEDKSFAWDKIRLIHQNLNKRLSLSALNEMVSVYEDIKSYEKACEIFDELYQETNELFYLSEVYKNKVLSGDMKGAKAIAHKYIEKLTRERRSDEIFKFIAENETKLDTAQVLLWKVEALLISGDRESFLELYEKANSLHDQNLILQEYMKYTEKKTNYWQSCLKLMEILLKRLSEDNSLIIASKKQVAKFILNLWMEKTINQDLIAATIKISKKYQLSIIGVEIAQYMGDVELETKFENLQEGKEFEDVDLGEDLFIEGVTNRESKESAIIRNIKLLRSLERERDVERELSRLKKINPEHELLDFKTSKTSTSSDRLYDDLMSEFRKYTFKQNKQNDEERIEDGYKNLANYYDYSYIQENYEYMIIGLNLLSLYNVALNVANMVDKTLLQENDIINLEYLKLETSMLLQKYFIVRDGVDDIINNFPVKGNELLSFLYLRAQAYVNLNQYKNAYYAFMEISRIKNNYRNTRQRLEELEEHK